MNNFWKLSSLARGADRLTADLNLSLKSSKSKPPFLSPALQRISFPGHHTYLLLISFSQLTALAHPQRAACTPWEPTGHRPGEEVGSKLNSDLYSIPISPSPTPQANPQLCIRPSAVASSQYLPRSQRTKQILVGRPASFPPVDPSAPSKPIPIPKCQLQVPKTQKDTTLRIPAEFPTRQHTATTLSYDPEREIETKEQITCPTKTRPDISN